MKLAYVHNGYWPSSSPSSTFVTYNALALCTRFDEIARNFPPEGGA